MKKVSIFLSLVCIMLAGCNSGEKVPALTGISLNKSELTLDLDETYRLRVLFEPKEAETEALVVKWESTKPKVATVDDNGKVTAVSEGKTSIIATCGKFSAECDVTVEKYIVPELEVSPLSIETSEAGGKYTIDVVSRRGWTVKRNRFKEGGSYHCSQRDIRSHRSRDNVQDGYRKGDSISKTCRQNGRVAEF